MKNESMQEIGIRICLKKTHKNYKNMEKNREDINTKICLKKTNKKRSNT